MIYCTINIQSITEPQEKDRKAWHWVKSYSHFSQRWWWPAPNRISLQKMTFFEARLCKALQETIDERKVLVVSSITASLFLLCPTKGLGARREHERQPSDGASLWVLGQDNMNRFWSDTKMLFKRERWAYQVNTDLSILQEWHYIKGTKLKNGFHFSATIMNYMHKQSKLDLYIYRKKT